MRDINLLQTHIMEFVKEWCDGVKTPVPQSEIIRRMEEDGTKAVTAKYAIYSLIDKGYIRVGYSEKANKTVYVMIRNI